jgi:hypothetical protein
MDTLVSKFEEFNMNDFDIQNQLTEFISNVDNDFQSEIILKLFCGYSGNMYLEDYQANNDCLQIHMLGSKNNNKREKYTVTIKNNKCSCTCKDFQYRARRLNIVCKHITFIVCKVAHILDCNFFETKELSKQQFNKIQHILNNNAIWKNRQVSVKDLNKEFLNNTKNYDPKDTCPICYELLNKESELLSCPQCKNYIHKECMDIWLETKNTCVYCRSYDWKNYVVDISQI